MATRFRIGVVGYSHSRFDHAAAAHLLEAGLGAFAQRFGLTAASIEIVSGLTNIGVPRIAYELAVQRGMRTVGLSAACAFSVSCGVFPVDEQVIHGEAFGEESAVFVDYIDALLRVGGGTQSLNETAMFRARCEREDWKIASRLIEYELALTDIDRTQSCKEAT